MRRLTIAFILALLFALPAVSVQAAPAADGGLAEPGTLWILTALLGLLMPIGALLVLVAGAGWDQLSSMASAGLLALFLAILGYYATGFALQFGGIGWSHTLAGLEGLAAPFVSRQATTAGLAGTVGFFLRGAAAAPGPQYLFFSHLPWVMTATLIPVVGLQRHAPGWLRSLLGLLVAALAYPLLANWSWAGGPTAITAEAGGWLGNLGVNAELGHGLVDFGGAGAIHLLGGAVTLAGLLLLARRRPAGAPEIPAEIPAPQLPLLAVLGAFVWLVGWSATLLAHPLYAGGGLNWGTVVLNALAGLAAGAALSQIYAWFATGQANALMAARGGAAGLVVVSAGAPFLPLWAALLAGGLIGLLLPLLTYLVEEIWRVRDPAGVLPVSLAAGLLGLLLVGLLASGAAGAGWNQVGAESYLGVAGQGVTGLLPAAGFAADSSQLVAQALGATVILALGLLASGLLCGGARLLIRGWGAAPTEEEE